MKKIFCLFLTITMLFSIGACNKADETTAQDIGALKKIVVNGFENSADMGMLMIGKRLGKVQLQQESEYIKSGAKSAKLSITGDLAWGTPYMYQTFNIEGREEYYDFTKNVKMSLWVYNADEVDHNLQAEYSFASGTLGKLTTHLKAKEWTQLIYEIDRQYLPTNNKGEYYPCKGIYFYFDISKTGEAYDLYFDELSLYRTEKGFNKSEIYLNEHEICSFDHAYQHSMLSTTGDYLDVEASLEISQDYAVKDKDFNMKVNAPAGATPYQNGGGWPGIEVNRTLVKMFDFSSYDDEDLLCFDVYTPTENGLNKIWVTLRNSLAKDIYKGGEIALTPGEWKTVKISVAEINANAERPDEFGFIDTTRIIVRWGEFTGADRTAYFNNFRMELQ